MPRMIWQEYDCPHSFDFDLHGDEILAVGEKCYFSGCGGEHRAGADGPTETYVTDERDDLQVRPLPKDADEKAAWLAEFRKPAA